MRGHREDIRRKRLSAEHRCWECADLLAFDDVYKHHYCAKCRATAEAEIWRLSCEGELNKNIARIVNRSPSMVHDVIARFERNQAETSTFARDDGMPRCRCGLRIDKDHLKCDLYGAASLANNRRGVGPTYPGNGWQRG